METNHLTTSDRPERPWAEIVDLMSHGQRVDVQDATITGVTPLPAGLVQGQVQLKNCTVRGKVALTRITFGESLLLTNVSFEEGLSLEGCSIAGDLVMVDVICKTEANFEGLLVHGRGSLQGCTFEPCVNFTLATFKGYTDFSSDFKQGADLLMATFNSALIIAIQCGADFDMTFSSLGGLLHVQPGARINGTLNLSQLSAAGTVLIQMESFGPASRLRVDNARLGASLVLEKGTFSDASDKCVDLHGIDVAGDVSLSDMVCRGDPAKPHVATLLTLEGARVGGSVRLSRMTCEGGVEFLNANISRRLWLDGTVKGSPDRKNVFTTVNLSGVKIGGDFWAHENIFNDDVTMSNIVIGGNTFIMHCEFSKVTDFNRAQFGGVFGCMSRFKGSAFFEGAGFRKAARFVSDPNDPLWRCNFARGADFYFAQFDQEANFGGTTIAEVLDLRYARFSHALLFERKWLLRDEAPESTVFSDESGKVILELRGCTYETLVLPNDFSELSDFTGRIPSDDLPSLVFLERFLRRSGRMPLADEVRRERYARERHRIGFKPWTKECWWNWSYLVSTDYGTTIWQMLFAIVFFGIAGTTAGAWSRHVLPHKLDQIASVPVLIKLACTGIVVVASGLFADALRRRFYSD